MGSWSLGKHRCNAVDIPHCCVAGVVRRAVNYQPHPDTGSKVVLTIAHVWDRRPEQASPCQRCLLNWDRREHGFNRLRNRIARLMRQGQIPRCLPREDSLAMALYDEWFAAARSRCRPSGSCSWASPLLPTSGSDRVLYDAQVPMLVRFAAALDGRSPCRSNASTIRRISLMYAPNSTLIPTMSTSSRAAAAIWSAATRIPR